MAMEEGSTSTMNDGEFQSPPPGAKRRKEKDGRNLPPPYLEVTPTKTPDTGRFTCRDCGKAFSDPLSLENHLTTHQWERPYACDQCDKTYRDEIFLKRHRRVHSTENLFACDVCGEKFSRRITLVIHRRSHSDGPFIQCDECGKSFRHQMTLLTHKSKAHGTEDWWR